jgi:hypothetical protein
MGSSHASRVAKTSTEALRHLWDPAFFRAWKKKSEIEAALAKKGNHFSGAELGMALMRAPHLTRRGKRGSYEYIQKYPCVSGDAEAATRGKDKRK